MQEQIFPKKQKSKSVEHKDVSAQREEEQRIGPRKVMIVLGICAMSKKSHSRPMKQILSRIKCAEIDVVVFEESMILKDPIKKWPIVDALITFYSKGYPFNRVQQYVKLRNPFLINDLKKQLILLDRRLIYDKLKENQIPIAKHYFVIRDVSQDLIKKYRHELHVQEEYPSVLRQTSTSTQNVSLMKRSSQEIDLNKEQQQIQNVLSYILQFEGKEEQEDVPSDQEKKVVKRNFTMGEIQLRKKIQALGLLNFKGVAGTEVQQFQEHLMIGSCKLKKPFVEKPFDAEDHRICIYYPMKDGGGRKNLFRKIGNISSSFEPHQNNIRTAGNYIYQEFLQTDGFDIKVYTVGPNYMHAEARKSPSLDGVVLRTDSGKEVRFPVFLTPFEKFIASRIVQVFGQNVCGFDLLRSNGKSYVCDVNGWSFVKDNQKYFEDCASILKGMLLEKFAPHLINEGHPCKKEFITKITMNEFRPNEDSSIDQYELRSVVAVYRHGQRTPKQKMKMKVREPLYLEYFTKDKKEVKIKESKELAKFLQITNKVIEEGNPSNCESLIKLLQLKSVLEIGGHFEGLNRKVQLKAISHQQGKVTSALMIVKWGGELTDSGEEDALKLGLKFRLIYPEQKEGFLRLHSTYRHDLKTYSSDEGRCQKTAASFLKGFLQLQGDLAPILASLVNRTSKAQFLLDCSHQQNHNELQIQVKDELSQILNSKQAHQQPIQQLGRQPRAHLQKMYNQSKRLVELLQKFLNIEQNQTNYYINPKDIEEQKSLDHHQGIMDSKLPYGHESYLLMYKRWRKIVKDFYSLKDEIYDVTKIPQIFDMIRYDCAHNQNVLGLIGFEFKSFYEVASLVGKYYVNSQYGIHSKTKIKMAKRIALPLFKKIYIDLIFWRNPSFEEEYWKYKQKESKNLKDIESRIKSFWRHVRTRLYFTSASHLYSLFFLLTLGEKGTLLKSCGLEIQKVKEITHLGYLSSVVLRLFQNLRVNKQHPQRFKLQISFSKGVQRAGQDVQMIQLSSSFNIHDIDIFFKSVIGILKD